MDNVAIKSNEIGFGYCSADDSLRFWGAVPAECDIEETLRKIKEEILAAKAGRDAHRAVQGKA